MTTRVQHPDRGRAALPAGATRWGIALIFLAVLVAYFPALHAGFIWDDQPGHVTRPELRTWGGLGRIWLELGATQQYYPLLHSAFWIEHRLWGDSPVGYHAVNLLLHATAACLFGAVLRRLAVAGAGLAALLFAVHPIGVESVAWISEQKNTLSTVLYLCAALAYLRYDVTRQPRFYALALLGFVFALLTKTVTATLPAALLVAVGYRSGQLRGRRDVVPLLPWFVLSAAAGSLTIWVERAYIGAQGTDFALGPAERVLLAGRALAFYLTKLLWPADLIFIYPRWKIDVHEAGQWLFPVAAVSALVLLAWRRRQHPGWLASALFFAGSLFPALGFVNIFPFVYSFVADHFQYLASLGVFALLAAVATTLATSMPAWIRRGGAALWLAALGTLTWGQASTYRDVFTLYRTTLARNPTAWMAHNNLAIALVEAGRAAEALGHYEQAIALRPAYAEAENNYGYALNQLGRPAEAVGHLERAIQLQPNYADAHNNLGGALMRLARPVEGIAAFTTAIRLNPQHAVAHCNLGLALASRGDAAGGIPHFQQALQLDPTYAEAELSWAIALTLTWRVNEALPHFERALALKPDVAHAHHSFGRALASAGQ